MEHRDVVVLNLMPKPLSLTESHCL